MNASRDLAMFRTMVMNWIWAMSMVLGVTSSLRTDEPVTSEHGAATDGRSPAPAAVEESDLEAKHFTEQIKPLFAKHCQDCHSGEKPKGDFLINKLSLDFATRGTACGGWKC